MSKYVITLAQIKGGVAKTTSVINTAAALAENGKKCL
jgi:cellulose biosynthesis protein BcsQ